MATRFLSGSRELVCAEGNLDPNEGCERVGVGAAFSVTVGGVAAVGAGRCSRSETEARGVDGCVQVRVKVERAAGAGVPDTDGVGAGADEVAGTSLFASLRAGIVRAAVNDRRSVSGVALGVELAATVG